MKTYKILYHHYRTGERKSYQFKAETLKDFVSKVDTFKGLNCCYNDEIVAIEEVENEQI